MISLSSPGYDNAFGAQSQMPYLANALRPQGELLSNYTLPTAASGAGHITAQTLTASIVGDPTKPYDGNTNATLTAGNFSLSGLLGSDPIMVTQNSGTYNSASVAAASSRSPARGAARPRPARCARFAAE